MNFDRYRFVQRLKRLEALKGLSAPDDETARIQRLEMMALTATDPLAMELYTQFLTQVSDSACRHRGQGYGACPSCIEISPAVQEAMMKHAQRLAILKHDQDGGGQALSTA